MIRTEKAIKLLKQKNKCAFFTSLIIVLIFLSNRSDIKHLLENCVEYYLESHNVLANPQLEY